MRRWSDNKDDKDDDDDDDDEDLDVEELVWREERGRVVERGRWVSSAVRRDDEVWQWVSAQIDQFQLSHVTGPFKLARVHQQERRYTWTHRSVLNILDSLLANQIPAKGVVTIVCRIEIRKIALC